MVRSYLIENRICFDSDPGSGGAGGGKPDRSNPSEMRAREQGFVDSRYGGDSEAFMSDVDAGAYSDLAKEEQAAAEAQARSRSSGSSSDGAAPSSQSLIESLQSIPAGSIKGSYTGGTPKDNFYADAYNKNRGRGGIFDGPPRGTTFQKISSAVNNSPVPTVLRGIFGGTPPRGGEDEAAFQKGQMFGLARQGMTPEEEVGLFGGSSSMFDPDTGTFTDVPVGSMGGTLGTSFIGTPYYSGRRDPDYNGPFEDLVNPEEDLGGGGEIEMGRSIFPPLNDGSGGGGAAGGGIGEIPSDELAIDYLQNPYYAYSGFGNQYNPYGFAQGTMVDLLQSRGMTQPRQADTLGLFGNPRDFA